MGSSKSTPPSRVSTLPHNVCGGCGTRLHPDHKFCSPACEQKAK